MNDAVPCPLCVGDSRVLWEQRGYPIRECAACAHRFTSVTDAAAHIAAVYDDSYFTGGGAGYSNYLAEGELLRKRGRRYADMMTKIMGSAGSLIDVGAAAGFLLQGWQDKNWQGIGVEPNASMVEYGRRELNLDMRCGSLESLPVDSLPQVDCVAMIQVISHFPDPKAAVTRAVQALKPGGYLLIETWDRASRIARLCGRGWHEYSPPSVLHWFSRKSLAGMAEQCGLSLIRSKRTLRWIGVGHAKSLLRHMAATSTMGRIASIVATPIPSSLSIPYPGDDLFWSVFRKSK